MILKSALLFLFIASLLFWSCSAGNIYYEIPNEFRNPQQKIEFIQKYSSYIKDKRFFLDPGHGGEDRNNKGFEGSSVEADANLKVALALRDFLKEAGASVIMSRESDITVDLKERSYMANRIGADFFISIHHNAPGKEGDIWTNYTSTYYHAKETDYEYEPCEHDMAKFIQRDLAYAMRNSGGLGSFDGTYSDYWIYPKAGFSVLRVTEIPAILVECGFNTHHFESQRLNILEFNKIQAWGIFRGLCKYFAASIPSIISLNPQENFLGDANDLNLSFMLKDSLSIDSSSIKVWFDSAAVHENKFDALSSILNINLKNADLGNHIIRIIAANKNGNHSLPFHQQIIVNNGTKF